MARTDDVVAFQEFFDQWHQLPTHTPEQALHLAILREAAGHITRRACVCGGRRCEFHAAIAWIDGTVPGVVSFQQAAEILTIHLRDLEWWHVRDRLLDVAKWMPEDRQKLAGAVMFRTRRRPKDRQLYQRPRR